ncbi:MAG: hypothetical protein ACKVYV_06180 [Limisphaerales bacterium]
MARQPRPPRYQACQVLQPGPALTRLESFSVSGGGVKPGPVADIPAEQPLPAASVRRSWPELLRPRLDIAWLPPARAFLRVVTVPTNDPAEIPAMLELQLEKLTPLPVAQVVWSFEVLPAAAAGHETTVVLVVCERSAVEAYLGALEQRGFIADRLELPALHRLVTTPMMEPGVYLYPVAGGLERACLTAWSAGGRLQHVALLRLPAGPAWPAALAAELNTVAWSGELEGWMAGPQTLHLVGGGEDAAAWRAALEGQFPGQVRATASLAGGELAALAARRATVGESRVNLLPPEFARRYRQQFVDSLGMSGLGGAIVIYLVGVLLYFGVLELQKHRLNRVSDELALVTPAYTNALRARANLKVLQDQLALRFAALESWRAAIEALPAELTLNNFTLGNGQKLTLAGSGPGDAVQRVTEFSQELRQKQFNGTNLFAEVRVGSSAIRGAGPAATLTWSVEADLRRLEP